jgi:hypothetical protein
MTHSWIPCTDLDLAAAFGTLGVPMRPEVQVRADSGKEYVTVFLSTESATNPEIKTGALMKLLKSGDLEKQDPEHPLLYAITAIKNRHAVTRSIKETQRMILISIKGSKRTAFVRENITGEGLAMAERFLHSGRP